MSSRYWLGLSLVAMVAGNVGCSCGDTAVAPTGSSDASSEPGDGSSTALPDASADASTVPPDAGCAFTGACTPAGTANPCVVGVASCDALGAKVCTATTQPDGANCGTDQVCTSGSCVACKAGLKCSAPGNSCRIGALSCSGGPTCGNLTDAPNGLTCGTGQVCQSGQCVSCVQGGACTDQANPCLQGTFNCTGGAACTGTTPAANGTSCGQNLACLGGACSCQPGGSCSTGNPCQTGTSTCDALGKPVCGNLKNTPNGTSCGQNLACITGACQCQPGGSCTIAGNPCQFGTVTCNGNTPSCTSAGNVGDGTPCGANKVCTAGACTDCTGGADCLSGICKLGTLSCSRGAPAQCLNPRNAQDGTVCGADQVCNGGSCIACKAGQSCVPAVCKVGVTDCSSGAQVCASAQNAPDGTNCGAGKVCVAGGCVTCAQGAACNPAGNTCQQGTINCAGGVPSCTFTANVADGTGCGPSQTCQAGACRCANQCATAGVTSCPAVNGTTQSTCTLDAATGCLVLKATACPTNQTCQGTACACNNTCTTAGTSQCAGATQIQTCTKDANNCLTLQPVPPASCPGNLSPVPCVTNACQCPAPGVGDLYVDASLNTATTPASPKGSDAYGNGSQTCPFASLTKALATASGRAGAQIVHAAAATYSTGESFPLILPSNVTLVGATAAGQVGNYRIRGEGLVGVGNRTATLLANGGTIRGFALRPAKADQAETTGVYCSVGGATLDVIDVQDYADGVFLTGTCTAVLSSSLIDSNSKGGGQAGVVITGGASAQINSCDVTNNFKDGLFIDSSSVTQTSLLNDGRVWDGAANKASCAKDGFSSNDHHGVHCAGSATFRMRSSKAFDNGFAGVYAEGSCTADLSGVSCPAATSPSNSFAINFTRSNNWANVTTTSTVKVLADHNLWENGPPPTQGTTNDYVFRNGAPAIDVSTACGTNGC